MEVAQLDIAFVTSHTESLYLEMESTSRCPVRTVRRWRIGEESGEMKEAGEKKQSREPEGEHSDDEMRIHRERGEEGLLQRRGHNLLRESLRFWLPATGREDVASLFFLPALAGTTLSFATHSAD